MNKNYRQMNKWTCGLAVIADYVPVFDMHAGTNDLSITSIINLKKNLLRLNF